MSLMDELMPKPAEWLSRILKAPFKAAKHIHSHQDEVYRIETLSRCYYLKISKSLRSEHDNLKKLEGILNVPKLIAFSDADENDYLLISELPGKNLVELIEEWTVLDIVDKFAKAIRQLHRIDVTKIFPEASPEDVLLHGDMALPNIIIAERGQIGYIDFGQMSFGSPELDLADAIWSLQRNVGPEYGELFLKKYGSPIMTPKIEAALKFRYQPAQSE
jgi:aminoglycoside phosphotransferase